MAQKSHNDGDRAGRTAGIGADGSGVTGTQPQPAKVASECGRIGAKSDERHNDGGGDFTAWVEHFARNLERQRQLEARVDWTATCQLNPAQRAAFTHSFQRFELGESGDGKRLLRKARAAGDQTYLRALAALVAEEQRHSALFARGLAYLGGSKLMAHWSDTAFTRLRRSLGLRTELALFLIAECVAMGYFCALRDHAPDPVLRGIGLRIATDERDHLRFQIDRLRQGFAGTNSSLRTLVGLVWSLVAAGAATTLTLDHAAALRACGLRPARMWFASMRTFRRAARPVLDYPNGDLLGPEELGCPQ